MTIREGTLEPDSTVTVFRPAWALAIKRSRKERVPKSCGADAIAR